MPQLIENCLPKGYIIKLYKRITNIPGQEIIDGSSFMTWMNFDCMDVISVHEFRNYNKSIAIDSLKPREEYASRQKFFLYCIDDETEQHSIDIKTEILSTNGSSLEKFPVITLTMLDIKLQKDGSCRKKILKNLHDCEKNEDSIKGQLYGSLSLYNYVLVLRGNDLQKMHNVLSNIRNKMSLEGIPINKMYTIAGIDCKNVQYWRSHDLTVSIRLSCTPNITSEGLKQDDGLKAALNIQNVYSIQGKYDFDIVAKIKSSEKFVSLFLKDGSLSAKRKDIHKTNTRFLNLDILDKSLPLENTDATPANTVRESSSFEEKDSTNISNNDLLDEILNLYKKIDDLSSCIEEALFRLVLRTFQVIITVNNDEMRKDLKEKLLDFLDFIYVHQRYCKNSDVIQDMALDMVEDAYAKMIETFNLLLDNRISAGMSDFETPQNVLRYSGSSMKILLAYSNFVNSLIEILSHNRRNINKEDSQSLKYLVFVTTDPVAKISATVCLNYSKQYRFISIKVPVDLIFEVRSVLSWITHEVGHFIRAGWARKDRNEAYYHSVTRAVMNRLIPYINEDVNKRLKQKKDTSSNADAVLLRINDDEGKKFDDYRETVKQYFQTIIHEYSVNYSSMVRIPYNKGFELLEDVEDITRGFKRIYEESIADMFMLQVLDIQSLESYLKIQIEYFERLKIDINNLPQENVSRIMAVSVVLSGKNKPNYDEVKHYFKEQYNGCCDNQIKVILEKLNNYNRYYFLEPLVEFLDTHVKAGLMGLLQQNEMEEVRTKIKDSYSNLENGKFEDYIDFVLNFK